MMAGSAYGHWFYAMDSLEVQDTLLLANAYGLLLQNTGGVFDNTVAINHFDIALEVAGSPGVNDNRFTGVLKIGQNATDCDNPLGPGGGFVDITCTTDGDAGTSDYGDAASDAVLYTGVNGEDILVGAQTEDTVQPFDDGGIVSGAVDEMPRGTLGAFEHDYRGFGWDATLADFEVRYTCYQNCRIWDFAPVATDTEILNINPMPSGDDVRVHAWLSRPTAATQQSDCAEFPGSQFNAQRGACETTHLEHAYERMGDRIGNDNGLCESGEHCIWVRNIGSYQGHGALVEAPGFVEGVLTQITMWTYENNGY
jgi:hypothetical protein